MVRARADRARRHEALRKATMGETASAASAPDASVESNLASKTDVCALDHTRFRNADAFKRVLHLIGAPTDANRIEEPQASGEEPITHFEWVGIHADIVTCNNPLTGELCDLTCASYMGLRADSAKHMNKVFRAVQRNKGDVISELLRDVDPNDSSDDGSSDSSDSDSSDSDSSDSSSDGDSSDSSSDSKEKEPAVNH